MANVARFAMTWIIGQDADPQWEAVCTFHVRRAATFPQYELDDIVALLFAFQFWWEDPSNFPGAPDPQEVGNIRDAFSADTRLRNIEGKRILPTVGPEHALNPDPPIPGTAPFDAPCMPQVAIGIGWGTDLASRRGRGRIFLPGPQQNAIDASGRIKDPFPGSADPANETAPTTLALWGRQLALRIGDAIGPTPNDRLAVMSRADGEARTVRTVFAQQYVVTQRRRLASLPREFVTVDAAAINPFPP